MSPTRRPTNAAQNPRPKLRDVAERAGVSIGTVSNVLNHPDKVAPQTLARVSAAIGDLGFSANSIASALASGNSRTIGLVVVTLTNSLFVDIARGAQRAARAANFMLQLASTDDEVAQQEAHLNFLDSIRVSGMLLAPMQEAHFGIEQVRRHGRPIVVLNYKSSVDDICTVLVDNDRVGYLAARHLIDLGRTRIAFVAGRSHLQPVAQRHEGARRAVEEAGGTVHLQVISVDGLEAPDGAIAGRRIASLPKREQPDAVLAVTDLLGMAIINELLAAQISVPGDIAVMGCDHNSGAWGGAIPLTSVSMQGEAMGAEGVRLLLEEMREPAEDHAHRVVVLQPQLIVRESTVGRPATANSPVRAGKAPRKRPSQKQNQPAIDDRVRTRLERTSAVDSRTTSSGVKVT